MKKMLTTMVAVAMMLAFSLDANAQFRKRENNRVPDRFHMGLRAGITASSINGDLDKIYGDDDYVKSLLFPYGGLALDFQVAPIPIFVGIGLNYMNMGMKFEYEDRHYSYSETYDSHSVQLPLTVQYHLNLAPNLFLQPFLGGWVAYDCTDIDEDKEEKGWNDDRFDYGLRFGCGLNFGRLYLDLGYDLGLKNWYDSDGHHDKYSLHRGIFFATLGFNWAGSR